MRDTLTQNLSNIAINPLTGEILSSTGQPNAQFNLVQYLPYPVIGFKVPQGVQFTIDENPVVQFKFFTDANGTTQIAPGDTIIMYAKAPSDPPTSFGVRIAEAKYRPWWEVPARMQGMGQFASGLTFPIEEPFVLESNYTLIIAVATLLSSETFNWTSSSIVIPITKSTMNY